MALGTRGKSKAAARDRRHTRLRKKIEGTAVRPRLVVTRSSRHLFVQIVDDSQGVTLASASTYKLTDGDKTAQAKQLGATLADAAAVYQRGDKATAAVIVWQWPIRRR